MASGREEAFKSRAVSLGSNQEGNTLTVLLISRPCSDSFVALPTQGGRSRFGIILAAYHITLQAGRCFRRDFPQGQLL
jgi:hypothetical protein